MMKVIEKKSFLHFLLYSNDNNFYGSLLWVSVGFVGEREVRKGEG